MPSKYPQYKIEQWFDTSSESLSKPEATILYGVQIKLEKGANWLHCHCDNEPLIYSTKGEASDMIKELKAKQE